MDRSAESHLSTEKGDFDTAPLPQRHRRAIGEKVNGQTDPYGADRGPTDQKVHPSRY